MSEAYWEPSTFDPNADERDIDWGDADCLPDPHNEAAEEWTPPAAA